MEARIWPHVFASNQSMRGVIERISALDSLSGQLWTAAMVLVLALAIVAIAVSHRRGDTVAAMLSAGLAGLLCSPVSWGHHWVWLSAATVYFLVRWAAAGRIRNLVAGVTLAVVTLAAPWMFLPSHDNRERLWNPLEHLLGSAWAVAAVLVLVTFATAGFPSRTQHLTRDDRENDSHEPSLADRPQPGDLPANHRQ
jgi:alpha-1,2-mannosyltransferase